MERTKIIAEEITHLIPKLLRGLKAGFIAAPQVTTSQLVTLLRIHEKFTTRVGVLSNELRVSAPTITGVIDRLLRDGYVKRTRDVTDRRVVNVELTKKGKNLVEHVLSEINKRWFKILVHLSEKEREDYLNILKRIVEILDRENV